MTTHLTSPLLKAHGVPHGFSVRTGGVSAAPFDSLNLGGAVGDDPAAVEENLTRLLADLGVERARFASVKQVHGDRVLHAVASGASVELRESRGGEALSGSPEADAIVAAPGVAIGVRVADCVPILLYDPISGAAAAVHAGWRGTVARIATKAVETLGRDYGARPRSLRAAIGPAIGPCCFEVGADLAERFAANPDFGERVVERPEGRPPHVNLFLANRLLLEAAGLTPDHIDAPGLCTSCDPTRFFSHRRDSGKTGRHLAVIGAGRF